MIGSTRRILLIVAVCLSVVLAGCAGWGTDGPAQDDNPEPEETDDLEDTQSESTDSDSNATDSNSNSETGEDDSSTGNTDSNSASSGDTDSTGTNTESDTTGSEDSGVSGNEGSNEGEQDDSSNAGDTEDDSSSGESGSDSSEDTNSTSDNSPGVNEDDSNRNEMDSNGDSESESDTTVDGTSSDDNSNTNSEPDEAGDDDEESTDSESDSDNTEEDTSDASDDTNTGSNSPEDDSSTEDGEQKQDNDGDLNEENSDESPDRTEDEIGDNDNSPYQTTVYVTDAETGESIEEAIVNYPGGTAQTDASGAVEFEQTYGEYAVTVEADGYESKTQVFAVADGGSHEVLVELEPDNSETEMVEQMAIVTVVDSNGNPVEGKLVEAGPPGEEPTQETYTDSNGEAVVTSVTSDPSDATMLEVTIDDQTATAHASVGNSSGPEIVIESD